MKKSTQESRMATKLEFLIRNVKDKQPKAMENLVNFFNRFEKPEEFAFLLLKHPELLYELMDSEYDFYWNNELKSCSPENRELEPKFEFQPPHYLTSVEFLVNYILGISYFEEHGFNTIDLTLISPPEHLDYRVLYSANHAITTGLVSNKQKEQLIEKLEKACPYHGTPGYLLLVSLYVHLTHTATHNANQEKNAGVRQELLRKNDSYSYKALKYVLIAQMAETTSQSEIHNAFYGKPLSTCLPFSAQSLPELYDKCMKELGIPAIPATQYTLDAIKDTAEKEFAVTNAFFQNRKEQLNANRQQKLSSNAQQAGRNHYLETPLLTAARKGDLQQIKKLNGVEPCVDWNAVDYLGNNALHLAILGECTSDVVKFLLQTSSSLRQTQNYNGDTATDLDEGNFIKKLLLKGNNKKPLGMFKPELKDDECGQNEKPFSDLGSKY